MGQEQTDFIKINECCRSFGIIATCDTHDRTTPTEDCRGVTLLLHSYLTGGFALKNMGSRSKYYLDSKSTIIVVDSDLQ